MAVPNGSMISVPFQPSVGLVNFNLNLDVSLFSCKPPEEFLPIGSALSLRRKKEAEGGGQHKIACRLGFLFNDIIPETPKLHRAYGTRISDILSRPGVNPRGTDQDGPFRDFIGADGTSIWAAATSIPASISVYLLACTLARAWDAKQATAIWVELVAERRRQIQDRLDQSQVVNPHTHLAMQQDYNREDLAKWDASARSWLRRADESMAVKRTQFSLILDNVKLPPFVDRGSTYEKITEAWFRSMEVLEALLRNEQRVAYDHVTLISISSWHLYPDLLIFQEETKKIPFTDHLFPGSAVLSLGIEYHDAKDRNNENMRNSTRWSLALSHLKYYGGPVEVNSPDTSRVTVDELWLVCLGTILRQWEVSISNLEVSVEWFVRLGRALKSSDTGLDHPYISWLLNLCNAASLVSAFDDSRSRSLMKFVKFGWRRNPPMLGSRQVLRPPFFGLCNPHFLAAFQKGGDREVGFDYHRRVASCLNLAAEDAFILRTTKGPKDSHGTWREWVTTSPVLTRLVDPECGYGAMGLRTHARWLSFENETGSTGRLSELEQERSERMQYGEYCDVIRQNEALPQRSHEHQQSTPDAGRKLFFVWPPGAPPIFGTGARFIAIHELGHRDGTSYQFLVRDTHQHKVEDLRARMAQQAMKTNVQDGLDWIGTAENGAQVWPYLKYFLETGLDTSGARFHGLPRAVGSKRKRDEDDWIPRIKETDVYYGFYYTLSKYRQLPLQWLISLRALEIISVLYRQLPTAKIPLRITETDLSQAKWLPDILRQSTSFGELLDHSVKVLCEEMSRANTFACIAMLESGQANIEVEHTESVMALCSEDSIFVAGILLSDPTTKNLGMNIQHLIGNVGHSGIVLMVAPLEPSIKTPGYEISLVDHNLYDGRRIDTFKGTSLHLSFTKWKMPVFWESTGEIDQQVFLLESVISVQDKGRWVADLNVLCLEQDSMDILEFGCDCNPDELPEEKDIASLDSWEELLDAPPSVGVVRSCGNWAARLSIASALVQKGHSHCAVLVANEPRGICWRHLVEHYAYPELHLPQFIIN